MFQLVFIIQMFASVSPMLMTDDMADLTPEEQYDLVRMPPIL